jgi:Concanavalin A-like lectin/glucanases superfamily
VHWAVTRAGPTLTLYRDGVPIVWRSDLPADVSVDPTGVIGMQGGWNTYLVRGGIDEVAVYGSALSGATIAAHVAAATTQAASASGSTPR